MAYPTLGSNGGTGANLTPFAFALAGNAPCGLKVDFTLTVTFVGNTSPRTFDFSVQTGKLANSSKAVKYAGPVVPIPDADPIGVNVPIQVSGVAGRLANLKFLIGGTACSADAGSTTVGIDHTFVGDLILRLTSPQGTTVTLINRAGGGSFGSSGNNFCLSVASRDNSRQLLAWKTRR